MMMLKSKQERPKVVESERCEGHRGFLNAGVTQPEMGRKGYMHVCKKQQKCVCLGGAGRKHRGQTRQRTAYSNKTQRSETL